MNEGRWRITVTAPDWGSDHLSSDAIVAFVDGELAHGPRTRAAQHLQECAECSAQVVTQGQASTAVRVAPCPSLPTALLSRLGSIPQDTDLPGVPAGLAMTADGQLVSVLRPERAERPRHTRSRTDQRRPDQRRPEHPAGDGPDRRRAVRGMRLGTGVAVSGLALGALALGASGAPAGTMATPPADRGLLGGTVLGVPASGRPSAVIDARLRMPAVVPALGQDDDPADLLDSLHRPVGYRAHLGLP